MKLIIKQDAQNKRTYDLLKELPDRVEAIVRMFPVEVAEHMLDEVFKMAPTGIEGYPEMLEVRRMMLPGIDSTSVIMAPGSAHAYKLRLEDIADTVLYVKPKRISGSPDPAAVILAEHNPWTMDTLPFEPTNRQAAITSRKVSKREMATIRERRQAEKPDVINKLSSIGVDSVRLHPLLSRRVGRDIAFEVMRREFGLQGDHSAHWRPALRKARTTIPERLLKKIFIRWLAVPSEQRWKRKITLPVDKAKNAKRYKAFQDMVAGS